LKRLDLFQECPSLLALSFRATLSEKKGTFTFRSLNLCLPLGISLSDPFLELLRGSLPFVLAADLTVMQLLYLRLQLLIPLKKPDRILLLLVEGLDGSTERPITFSLRKRRHTPQAHLCLLHGMRLHQHSHGSMASICDEGKRNPRWNPHRTRDQVYVEHGPRNAKLLREALRSMLTRDTGHHYCSNWLPGRNLLGVRIKVLQVPVTTISSILLSP